MKSVGKPCHVHLQNWQESSQDETTEDWITPADLSVISSDSRSKLSEIEELAFYTTHRTDD